MATYYKCNDGYLAVTEESPRGFQGVLFVGRGPKDGKIVEQAFAVNELAKLAEVDLTDVPADWVISLGYDKIELLPVFDQSGDHLLDLAPIRRARPAKVDRPWTLFEKVLVTLAFSAAILWYLAKF